jgi:hypothetical protein
MLIQNFWKPAAANIKRTGIKIYKKYDSREIVSLKQGNIISMDHKSMIRDYRRAGPRISAELFAGCAEWLEGWAELGWAWPIQHQKQQTA